jgi:NTP pyrophosphatase (non-canonical NTP hydrolase)
VLTNLGILMEETGELAEVLLRKYAEPGAVEGAGTENDLGDELADVLWVLLCLANQTGTDLTRELNRTGPEIKLRAFRQEAGGMLQASGGNSGGLTSLGILTMQAGKLARILVRKYGEQSFKESDKAAGVERALGDLVFTIMALADGEGIDLAAALAKNFGKKSSRDKDRHRENDKL